MLRRKIGVVSDTHFFHENIRKGQRSEFATLDDMHEHIIRVGNTHINENDIVIHLGDVTFKKVEKKEEIKAIFKRLKGNKILIPGNHDRDAPDRHYFNDLGFNSVEGELDNGMFVINDIIFSHEPIAIIPKGYVNIHGHVHKGVSADLYAYDKNRVNVCGDIVGKPMDVKKIAGGML